MGGAGSGLWYRHDSKQLTSSVKSIDIRWLKRNGYLVDQDEGTIEWHSKGKAISSICYEIEIDCMILNYSRRHSESKWVNVVQQVYFDYSECHFGNVRPWFICPKCNNRVAILYLAHHKFTCRACSNLAYPSQNENQVYRLMRKARKIRRRLEASSNMNEPILHKPKFMHWKKFNHLREAAYVAETHMTIAASKLWGSG